MAVKPTLSAASSAVDPALNALFAGSAGPVAFAPESRYPELQLSRSKGPSSSVGRDGNEDYEEDDEEDDEEGVEASEDEQSVSEASTSESGSEDEASEGAGVSEEFISTAAEITEAASQKKDRKRKRKPKDDEDEDDDLEARHLRKLVGDDGEQGPAGKRRKGEDGAEGVRQDKQDEASEDDVPVHESLSTDPAADEIERASRTVFLSNVSSEAITSGKAKRALLAHLSSVLDKSASPLQSIESVRFRSTAFSTAAIPKRAAFIKKSVMDATTRSTNAYVVFSVASAVRIAVSKLNGTVVLDRHLRVDSVAHPSAVDHYRCVFVGNLGFVDDESVLDVKTNEEGKAVTEKRKRIKSPMDVEEGLWRVFGKEAGKVESVRVIRDPVTRVGKGIAYVQFYNENAVESALLLSGRKFPPMLPRELRVSRCKAPHKTARAIEAKQAKTASMAAFSAAEKEHKGKGKGRGPKPESTSDYVPKPSAEAQTLAGRANKLLGRSGATRTVAAMPGRGRSSGRGRGRAESRAAEGRRDSDGGRRASGNTPFKSPEGFIFEGRRASAKDGKPKDLKFKGGGKSGKKKSAREGRGGLRAAKWKAQGGK